MPEPFLFKIPGFIGNKPDTIQHEVPSEPAKALQLEDIEQVVHESLLHPLKAINDLLQEIAKQNEYLKLLVNDTNTKRQYHDDPAQVGKTLQYVLKYFRHLYVYCYSNTGFTLKTSNGGSQVVPANYWTLVNYPEGTGFTVFDGDDTNPINVTFRSCDVPLIGSILPYGSVGTALTPWSSNPTQTAAAAADTVFKFGANGDLPFRHFNVQNNSGANLNLAVDADTTVATTPVYVLATGQLLSVDRYGVALHFSSAAQQNFQGTSGITVEGFA